MGLPELVAHDLADYETRAVALGTEPGRRRAARAALDGDRTRLPLFDSARFERELEAELAAAVERAAAAG